MPENFLTEFLRHTRDQRRVDRIYFQRFNKHIDWKHPKTLNEKLNVFKISKKAESYWKYVDKYEVRSYVKEAIGAEHLTKVYRIYDSVDEIVFDKLPKAFALKCTHGSGWNVVTTDKSKLNWEDAKKKLKTWLGYNYYEDFGYERQYRLIKPRIMCEEYLPVDDPKTVEFKFYMFHGKPVCLNIIRDRFGQVMKNYYTLDWEEMPIISTESKGRLVIPKPKELDELVALASKLAAPFSQVRVDLYNVRGKIYFGELTFTSEGGLKIYNPPEYDEIFGKMWDYREN